MKYLRILVLMVALPALILSVAVRAAWAQHGTCTFTDRCFVAATVEVLYVCDSTWQ